ncbi:hypothetical protein HYFRA_00004167 [Hymenoscyphus fraxineus]|uniref:RING-type domain-containing protein n=1 Tax=Hymenoscyphus fraxineus TaxID=746836 RepID=A0A9N9KLD3_9HELO|nr:hypothetical protein HYFRA_00004167 [Hymenoscyphus fraxineus]
MARDRQSAARKASTGQNQGTSITNPDDDQNYGDDQVPDAASASDPKDEDYFAEDGGDVSDTDFDDADFDDADFEDEEEAPTKRRKLGSKGKIRAARKAPRTVIKGKPVARRSRAKGTAAIAKSSRAVAPLPEPISPIVNAYESATESANEFANEFANESANESANDSDNDSHQNAKALISTDASIESYLAYHLEYYKLSEEAQTVGQANAGKSTGSNSAGSAAAYTDGYKYQNGPDETLKPICTPQDAFRDIYKKVKPLMKPLLDRIEQKNGAIKVGTMCSGTDSPLIALNQIARLCELDGLNFPIHHSFSAEIVPFKQAFLRLNFNPEQLFQNVCELLRFIMDNGGNHIELPSEDIVGKETMTTAHGGKAVIPGDCDILLAGTCCTDFSIMNSKQKTLKAGGESGDTFFSMIAYATHYRPKIIILENVQSAPWLKEKWSKRKKDGPYGFDHEFARIHYQIGFVLLDTKEYYIPHTRSRGYMIAIDVKEMTEEERKDVTRKLKQWERLVLNDLKRPASTPVEMWLKRADDPLLIYCRSHWVDDLEKTRKPPRWDACQVNYKSYRHNLGLGEGRPVTSWGSDGYFQLPDFYQRKHNFGMTERVLDTLDISHLRGLLRGYDDRYFFRVTELGQNVYRDKEQNKQGVVSCQTPNAQQFVSVRGSRISGQEALNLQGLPVNGLDISRLSQADMQNLSGNAMTTTVVGIVTMAALTTFGSLLTLKGDRTKATSFANRIPGESQNEKLITINSSTWVHQALLTSEALSLSRDTLRLCYCEHRELISDKQFQQCMICLHTSCTSCGKKPTHDYKAIKVMGRKDVRVFEKLLLESLPMATKLVNLTEAELDKALDGFLIDNKHSIDLKTWQLILPKVRMALSSTVAFQGIRRSDRWEVTYESQNAKLVLSISATEARWDLFANVPNEPLSSPVGKYLRQFPIAQMFCHDNDDLTQGSFKLWAPKVHKFKATLSMSGPMIPTYENQVGIVSKQDDNQYSNFFLRVQNYNPKLIPVDIEGPYELSAICGQSFNCLYVQQRSKKSDKRLFMFLEPHLRHGAIEDHSIVIADNTRRLEHGEHRETKGKLATPFRFPIVKARRNPEDQSIISYTLDNGKSFKPGWVFEDVETTISVDGTWEDFQGIGLNKPDNDAALYRHLPTGASFSNTQCNTQHAVFVCRANIVAGITQMFPDGQWIPLSKSNEPAFLQDLKYLVQGGLVQDGHKEGGEWHTILNHASQTRCQACAPKPPRLFWEKKQVTKSTSKLTPFEDPVEAADYERACKSRADPISAWYLRNENNVVTFKVICDIFGLIHRAQANLTTVLKSEHELTMQYRLITNTQLISRHKKVPFSIPSNEHVPGSENLRHCLKFELRSQQADAIQWAIDMERYPKPWQAISVEEARIDSIGYRLEARAVAETPIRGALCAYDVGFGKTVVMLGLIQQRKKEVEDWANEKTPKGDAIRLKATLVLAPVHLLLQWAAEIKKFIKVPMKVVVIKDTKDWNNKAKVQLFMDADIIIMNMSLIDSGPYLRDLANAAAIVELDNQTIGKQNRAKKSWRQMAADSVKASMPSLLNGKIDDFVKSQRAAYDASVDACTQNQAPIPSKRVVGSKYMSQKAAKIGDKRTCDEINEPKKDALTSRDNYWKFIQGKPLADWKPILEMFEFARLIIDEYTYLNGQEDVIEFIRAHSRLILSGTPGLATCSEIFKIGRLLGAYVGTDDYDTTTIEHWKKISGDMTRAEDYQTHLTRKSDAYSHMQRQRAQEFLNMFARKDKADVDRISMVEEYRIMYLTLYQWAIYKESEQRVTNLDFDHKIHFNSVGGHSSQIFKESAQSCEDPREILIFRSTHTQPLPGIESYETLPNMLSRSCVGGHMLICCSAAIQKIYTPAEQAKRARLFREKKKNATEFARENNMILPENDDISDVGDVEVTPDDPEWVAPSDDEVSPEAVTRTKGKKGKQAETSVAPKVIKPAVAAEDMCKRVLEFRKGELVTLLNDFTFQLRKATWLQNNQDAPTDPKAKHEQSFQRWKARAVERQDTEIVKYLMSLIAKATLSHNEWYHFYRRTDTSVSGAVAKRNNKLLPVIPSGDVLSGNNAHLTQKAAALRTLVALLTRLSESLSSQVVSIRFIESLCCVIDEGTKNCTNCNVKLSIERNFTLLTSCGHVICDKCKGHKADTCPKCHAPYEPHQAITGGQLQKFNKSLVMAVEQSSPMYGEKVDSCMRLIKSLPKDDHVLLFVQFDLIHNEVRKALEANEIEYVDLKNTKANKKSQALIDYQEGSAQVLLLNIDDESAAGSNLTIANHIIFLTPYFVKGSNSQEKWNATMTQAVGRARRWGQKKVVRVYHFVTAETIDADIIQMRRQKKLLPTADNENLGELVDLDDPAEVKGPLSSSISHLLFRQN